MLPGPPRELRPMFDTTVVTLVQREFPPAAPFVCRTLRTTGLGESAVQEKVKVALDALVTAGLGVGYCARVGQVDVRLTASNGNAAGLVREAEAIVQRTLGLHSDGGED